ncbi:hypothetical protein M422DRAFT_69875 [Sphaerobolus stellatus SS14]|uniref:Unplaced genomic scaffold SPHSTscaffold_294, whole genome shotgun sequence n=1 Tax=Sphaerobolus stellatus (strain SS14) TaxID=990650 RepID=A0A0C9TXC7_SPHS4|nr:hypothetical protein M422DRAFT_71922 [Sphaerobolus stellatus SS14]KIJ35743.1 hypothetical protein M422DRAFT_69875 [Sphaerobolus stellatus SS14]
MSCDIARPYLGAKQIARGIFIYRKDPMNLYIRNDRFLVNDDVGNFYWQRCDKGMKCFTLNNEMVADYNAGKEESFNECMERVHVVVTSHMVSAKLIRSSKWGKYFIYAE